MDLDLSDEPLAQAIFYRGLFLHYYAGLESVVNDFLTRLCAHPAYQAQGFAVTFHMKSRLNTLSRILDSDGPIKPFREEVRHYVNHLLSVEPERHMMAHGIMSSLGGRYFEFLTNGHVGKIDRLRITIDEMQQLASWLDGLCQMFEPCFVKICAEAKLPKSWIEVGSGSGRKPDPKVI